MRRRPLSASESVGVVVGLIVSGWGWIMVITDSDTPLWMVVVMPAAFGCFAGLVWAEVKWMMKRNDPPQ